MYDMKISDSIVYVGVDDKDIDLFESQYKVPNGVTYNSYVILDEKIAVMDTVDKRRTQQWLDNLEKVLDGRKPDYLVVSHLEPDHASNIQLLAEKYPDMQVVSNAKVFSMLPQFFTLDFAPRSVVVKEGDTLSLGNHTLQFFMAPMVHWPEVMVEYEQTEKILFSADGFGKFGASDVEEDWDDEARRYFINIVGKYGTQVQALLKKAATLDIQMICPLHGPIWRTDLDYFIGKYNLWSKYEPEEKGVMIAYASMYGNTGNMAEILAVRLAEAGVKNIRMHNISRTHVSELISDSFKYSHLILAAPTYNNGIYPLMDNYLEDMKALGLSNRTVAVLGNGSWAPQSTKLISAKIGEMKNMRVMDTAVSIKSAVKDSQMEEIESLARQIAEEVL